MASSADSRTNAKDQQSKEATAKNARDATKKGLESAVMGHLQNIKSIKLSDFIDESFLAELEGDLEKDEAVEKNERKPLSELMKALCDGSTTRLPMTKSSQNVQTLASKRRKVSGDGADVQTTHLILSPLLAVILKETE